MIHAYTGQAVRAAEEPLLDAGHGAALMRRAAWGLASHVVRRLRSGVPVAGGPDIAGPVAGPTVAGTTVAALVGAGNNGGDALWALSFLRRRGIDAVAVPTGERMHGPGLEALLRAGGRVADRVPERAAILIDAVLGTGARGGWDPQTVPEVPAGVTVIACDVPSGVDADTGHVAGTVIPAEVTVTFGALKTGLLVGAGAQAAGRLEVVDIGIGPYLGSADVSSMEAADALAVFAPPAWDDHKYRRGVLGVAAGSGQYPGAAVLVCSAAVASGLGMVQYSGPPEARRYVLSALPEIVAGPGVEGKAQAWVAGSGLGSGDEARSRLAEVIDACVRGALPLVLDASALDLVSRDDLDRLRSAGAPVVLTPHQGELLRLMDRLAPDAHLVDAGASSPAGRPRDHRAFADLAKTDPVAAARTAAAELGAVVLYKGTTTVCATPGGHVLVQGEGGAELATAGSGDTLSGLVGSALARTGHGDPTTTVEQAAAAVWLHGMAGARAATSGPFGASALAGAVRRVLTGR